MRKLYLLIVGSLALGVGLVIGAVGYALATTPTDDSSRIAFWNKDSQSTTGGIDGTVNVPPKTSNLEGLTSEDERNQHLTSPEEEVFDDFDQLANPDAVPSKPSQNNVADVLAQEILADYKLNVAKLFEAWKSPDMITFRAELKEAYTGDLFERHARQAEPFIAQGVGLQVSDIRFANVKVDAATSTTATLTASYTYTAQDYDIGNQSTLGESTQHQVKVRVNMVKENSRWLITGETILQP